MPDNPVLIPVNVVRSLIEHVLRSVGTPEGDAAICADVLLAADLRGVESHGLARLKYYYDRLQAGVQNPITWVEVVQEAEATALVDGHHGMGHVIAHRSMQIAIEKARQAGVGAVAVRNSTHYGIAGYYPLMAAQAGMMGLTVTNARPATAPTFGAEPMLGTNPIAFAAPSDLPYPFCFDAATSIAQRGKIEVAARAEKPVPEGWVIDSEGQPITDAAAILDGLGGAAAALLPLGGAGELLAGYKGYGLATMVEILSASLCGGAYLKGLLGFAADGSRRPYMLGHFFLAIDIERFLPLGVSRQITGAIMRGLQASRKAQGHERIWVAGEKEHEAEQRIRRTGVPTNHALRQELMAMRDELGLSGFEAYF